MYAHDYPKYYGGTRLSTHLLFRDEQIMPHEEDQFWATRPYNDFWIKSAEELIFDSHSHWNIFQDFDTNRRCSMDKIFKKISLNRSKSYTDLLSKAGPWTKQDIENVHLELGTNNAPKDAFWSPDLWQVILKNIIQCILDKER